MVLLDGDTDRQDEKYEVVRCWQKNGSFYLFQVSQDEDYPNDYGEEYEGEDYEEGEYEDDYGGDYEGDYDEEYEGDYDEQESEGGDEDYYDYDYEENKSEDAEDEGSDDYSDYDYDDEDAVNEEDLTESETEVVDIGSSSSSSGNGETSDTAGQVEPLDGTEKTPEVKLTQSGEQEIEATIDVDEVDDVIEDYFEAAYDELAEDGSGVTEDSFGSEESESLNTESQHEDKKQNEVDIITDDEDFTDGSGEEMEEHEPSSTTMSSTTSTTLTTSTTTTTRTTISTSTPAFPTPIKSHTPTINTFDDEDHRGSGDDDEDVEKEGSGVASHPVSVPPNFVTDDEDYDDEEEGSSPQVANHCPFHSHHDSLYEGGPWRPDRGGVDGLDHWRGQQDQEDLLWYPRGVAVRNQDEDNTNTPHPGGPFVVGHLLHGRLHRRTQVSLSFLHHPPTNMPFILLKASLTILNAPGTAPVHFMTDTITPNNIASIAIIWDKLYLLNLFCGRLKNAEITGYDATSHYGSLTGITFAEVQLSSPGAKSLKLP